MRTLPKFHLLYSNNAFLQTGHRQIRLLTWLPALYPFALVTVAFSGRSLQSRLGRNAATERRSRSDLLEARFWIVIYAVVG